MDFDRQEGERMTMKNINLDKYSPFHKTGHTSKGDQRKWEIDGIWYKADYMGYEESGGGTCFQAFEEKQPEVCFCHI